MLAVPSGSEEPLQNVFSPVGSACCFKIKLVLVSKQEQDSKIKFSEECCESCVKNKPQNIFSLPHSLACLCPLFACHASLSVLSVDVLVGGKAGVLMLRCCGEQEWQLMGAGKSWLGHENSFLFLFCLLSHIFLPCSFVLAGFPDHALPEGHCCSLSGRSMLCRSGAYLGHVADTVFISEAELDL